MEVIITVECNILTNNVYNLIIILATLQIFRTDFAVGAPYDGPDERGAVYLFHGSASGVRESHSQVIYAEDIVGSPFTFGFSLSGGKDLDENEYPDLVVGAYDSNTAVFLR